ncbi:MAG: polysaccharide deacetylase family protein [Dissulfuribacterales bacterium]
MITGINILMYHQVGRFEPMHLHRASFCDAERFAAQMAMLKYLRFNVLDIDTALACLRGKRNIPPRAVVLTFDDAYVNFLEYALPVLLQYGFPAVVYAIAGKLGGVADWYSSDGMKTPPLMNEAQLRELLQYNITIGAHGLVHTSLTGLSQDRLQQEILHSRTILEQKIGASVRHFCYPYGSHDIPAMRAVRDAGFMSAVTCERGLADMKSDPLALPRKAISFGDDLVGFAWKLFLKNKPKHPLLKLDSGASKSSV